MTGPPRRVRLALAGVAVLLLVLAVFAVTRSTGGPSLSGAPGGAPATVARPTPTAGQPAVDPGAVDPGAADPTPEPSGTEPAAAEPPATAPGAPAEAAPSAPAETPLPAGSDLPALVRELEPGIDHLEPIQPGEIAHVPGVAAVSLDSVERVNAQATVPGDPSGPAVALAFTLVNEGDGPLTLDDAVVNLYADAGAPGSTFTSHPRADPFTGVLEPGARATATYVVSLPPTSNGQVVVSLYLAAGAPSPLFTTTVSEES